VKVPFKVPAVKRLRLKNGLSVILAESHKLPLVSVDLILKTGGSANAKDKAGLANSDGQHARRGNQEADRAPDRQRGGATRRQPHHPRHLGRDSGFAFVLADNLERALPVWADVLLNPAFAQDDFERVTDNLFPRWPSARTTRRWSRARCTRAPCGATPIPSAGQTRARKRRSRSSGRRT
jgi:predicted Zn-dependent peptidase